MSSREKILAAVKQNQPEFKPLPELNFNKETGTGLVDKFIALVNSIGGQAQVIDDIEKIPGMLLQEFPEIKKRVAADPGLTLDGELLSLGSDPHRLSNTDVSVIRAVFGVAENGAVWVREEQLGLRVLPFICQHLAIIINAADIVATMHDAYDRIGEADYSFATFIAGPSKTADIEQSLVLGAHGPISMRAFIIQGRRQEAEGSRSS